MPFQAQICKNILCEPIYHLQNTELFHKQNTSRKTGGIIPISPELYTTQKIMTKIVSIKTCILYTFLYSLESNTKLRIDAELSDHKNIIFSVLKKLEWASVRHKQGAPNWVASA